MSARAGRIRGPGQIRPAWLPPRLRAWVATAPRGPPILLRQTSQQMGQGLGTAEQPDRTVSGGLARQLQLRRIQVRPGTQVGHTKSTAAPASLARLANQSRPTPGPRCHFWPSLPRTISTRWPGLTAMADPPPQRFGIELRCVGRGRIQAFGRHAGALERRRGAGTSCPCSCFDSIIYTE